MQRAPRAPCRVNSHAIGRRRSPIARCPPINGRSVGLISHANRARSPSTARLRAAVLHLLYAHRWSPEQIAHGLPQRYPDDPTMRISHEAIYTYLYVLPSGALKRELARYLRRRHRFRRPHEGPSVVAAHSGSGQH